MHIKFKASDVKSWNLENYIYDFKLNKVIQVMKHKNRDQVCK